MATANSTVPENKYSLAHQTSSGRTIACPKSACPGPKSYAMSAEGDCLLPEYKSGDIVICDPDQSPEPGDLVGIWWKDGARQPWIKKLFAPIPSLQGLASKGCRKGVFVEMLNPPEIIDLDPLDIDAIHKVIHVIQK